MTPAEVSASSHDVEVSEFGTFTFLRRTWPLQSRIEKAVDDIFGPDAGQSVARNIMMQVSVLQVLMVQAPAAWDIDLTSADPLDVYNNDSVYTVYSALVAAEATFRTIAQAARKGAGTKP